MKLNAAIRAQAPARCFAMRDLRKYYICDAEHVGQAVRRFRDNKILYTPRQRKLTGDAIACAWLRSHFPGLKKTERKQLIPRTRRHLRI